MNLCKKYLSLFLALAVLSVGVATHAGAEAPAGTAAKAAPKSIPLAGKVLETMNGGGYTYILLNNGGEKVWVAAPQMKVTVGQEIKLVPGFEMKNFSSKGLNRKFDKVIFTAGVLNQEIKLPASAMKMAHQGVPAEAAKAKEQAKETTKAAAKKPSGKVEKVAKATGPNSYTIAQLYQKKMQLEKKPVVVRGKVVKVATRIMKKNWIHIQDGTGSEKKKTNTLVVTSKELPNEGDIVTVKGTIYNNLDFGYGYKYALLVQDAKLK